MLPLVVTQQYSKPPLSAFLLGTPWTTPPLQYQHYCVQISTKTPQTGEEREETFKVNKFIETSVVFPGRFHLTYDSAFR